MSLVKYDYEQRNDPFSDLDTILNQVFRGGWAQPTNIFGRSYSTGDEFRLDVLADDDAYTVVAELPGLSKDDVDLQLHNAVLSISGERKQGEGEDAHSVKFNRSVTLGEDVDTEAVRAKMENGLLTVTLCRSEASKPKAISIN